MIELRHRVVEMNMHIVQHIAGATVFMIGQPALVMMRLRRQRKEIHMADGIGGALGLLGAGHFVPVMAIILSANPIA